MEVFKALRASLSIINYQLSFIIFHLSFVICHLSFSNALHCAYYILFISTYPCITAYIVSALTLFSPSFSWIFFL